MRQRFHIDGYYRYRDDILLLTSSSMPEFLEFFRILQLKCGVWKLKVESISNHSVPFLDLLVSQSCNPRRLQVGIFTKPTELHRPLGISSLHPIHTHLAWPKGLVHRAVSLTSTRALLQAEMHRLHDFFARHFGWLYAQRVLHHEPRKRALRTNFSIPSFLVLPYYRDLELFGGLRKVLVDQSQQAQAMGWNIAIRLAFKNRGQHLVHLLERHRHEPMVDPLCCFLLDGWRG